MSRLTETHANTALYARIQSARMSESEREVALNALRNAESMVDRCVWLAKGVRALIASIFGKPARLSTATKQ